MSAPLNNINPYIVTSGVAAKPAQSAQADKEDLFTNALTAMMLASSLSEAGSGSAGAGMLSVSPMIMLLEQILSSQLETQAEKADTGIDSLNWTAASRLGSTAQPYGRPVNGRVTQGSHPGHIALDFGVPVGTQVKSTMDGKVVYAGWNNEGYGNLVIVENGPYRTYYAHLSSIPVSVGDQIRAGSTIGLSGNTGNSTGPHLHYEIRVNQVHIDPTQDTLYI